LGGCCGDASMLPAIEKPKQQLDNNKNKNNTINEEEEEDVVDF